MNHWVPFLCAVCSRLLTRQGQPFVNEFPERQQLSRPHCSVYVCVCDYVHKHMFAVRGRHSLSSESERETEECLLGTAAGVAVMLFLLSVIVLCVHLYVCVCVCLCSMCSRMNWSKGWKMLSPLSLSANRNEGGSDVGERLHNLILLLQAYGFIMGLLKLIERITLTPLNTSAHSLNYKLLFVSLLSWLLYETLNSLPLIYKHFCLQRLLF